MALNGLLLRPAASDQNHALLSGKILYIFDVMHCMNDTIEFPFSSDLIGIGAAALFLCMQASILASASASAFASFKMTWPSFSFPVIQAGGRFPLFLRARSLAFERWSQMQIRE